MESCQLCPSRLPMSVPQLSELAPTNIQEILVVTILDNATVVKDNHTVKIRNGVQSVGYREDSVCAKFVADDLLHQGVRMRIDAIMNQ